MRIRQNINDLNDDTLLWYSRAVIEMKKRDITDPTSWWYQGAVHGYGVEAWPDFSEREVWSQATGFPPPQSLVDSEFWQQCQHGTWYFLPWHRMYLMFFEEIVAKTVQELGGPADWTLPYWNYCNAYNPALSEREQVEARRIPEAFGSEDGPNQEYPGLWIKERAHYEIQKRNVSCSQAMQRQAFTTEVARASFGGGVTGFSHNGSSTGQLEQLPHNVVHVDVGEVMGDPNTAALDPIFWLHHANIDRLWQSWLNQGEGRENPGNKKWRDFTFAFHNAQSDVVKVAVKSVENLADLGYTYSANYPDNVEVDSATQEKPDALLDVLAASISPTQLSSNAVNTELEFVPKPQRRARIKSLAASNKSLQTSEAKQTFIQLDNIVGEGVIAPVDVFIKLKGRTERHYVSSIGLFGLSNASRADARNNGNGLNATVDATEIVHTLRQAVDWDEEQLTVELEPQRALGNARLQVGRISIYSESEN